MFKFGLVAAVLSSADGTRATRSQSSGSPKGGAKFLSGVPILNYYMNEDHSLAGKAPSEEDWLLAVKAEVSDEEIHAMCQQSKCVREGHPKSGGVAYFEVHASEAELEGLLKTFGNKVKYVERDMEARAVPGIVETAISSTSPSKSWGLDRIAAPLRTRIGTGVSVYVLDTGVRVTHFDFGGRAVPLLDMSTGDSPECTDASCAGDVQGHGTHCAGTAAGNTAGVAPGASIKAVKVLGDDGTGQFSWSIDALDWVAVKGSRPAVASMSLGGPGNHELTKEAVEAAVAAGVTVVVAAGNSNADACSFTPAYVPSAITVGSTHSTDTKSWFSNFGSCVRIWAPGSAITSAGVASDYASYTMGGTSMACPHVSGAAAVLLEDTDSTNMSPDIVLMLLYVNATENAISYLKPGDGNKLLYMPLAASGPPAAGPVPPGHPSEDFTCTDGCGISADYFNDGFCDCATCEDEPQFTCDTCHNGCPTECGEYKGCR